MGLNSREHENQMKQLRAEGEIRYGALQGSGIRLRLKKLVRRLVSFLIVPCIQQQSRFNAHTADTFEKMAAKMEKTEAELAETKARLGKNDIVHLQDFLAAYDAYADAMETRIVMLEEKVRELEAEKKNGR